MLIPSNAADYDTRHASLSRRVNANSQRFAHEVETVLKLIKKGEC